MTSHNSHQSISKLTAPLLAACSCLLAIQARGAVYECAGWAAILSAEATTGYDSNLYLTREAPGSGYGSLSPNLVLKRKHTLSNIQFAADINRTDFFRHEIGGQTDWGLSANASYPNTDDGLPHFEASLEWNHLTIPSRWLGERIDLNYSSIEAQGRVYSTGKLGLNAGLKAFEVDSPRSSVSRNRDGKLTLGLAYDYSPKTELSLNYIGGAGMAYSREELTGTRPASHSRHNALGLQVKGDILSKLQGSLIIGADNIVYSGGLNRAETVPYTEAALQWAYSEKQQFQLSAAMDAGFSVEGESQKLNEVQLGHKVDLKGPWALHSSVKASRYDYYSNAVHRRDSSLGFGWGLAYTIENHWSARAAINWSQQWSTYHFFHYTRTTLELHAQNTF